MAPPAGADPASAPRQPLDLLVVGGGPAGTAAAFRATELGLRVLVIDYDDLMKRVRDYSKDKLILPGFGGGDKMRFPKGGPLVAALPFAPIDKDDMCSRWKGLYREHRVAARIGVELVGLSRRADGGWEALAWDHGARSEASFRARAVVVAVGRGVPRRFDIPGDADGIAFRLADPQRYLGRPACVIGGGTSAAEAVIAISNAKAAAGDPTAVHWSYRGDRMPRVSKALAEVFFEAYVGNGNIRYHPKSEPAAVVTADDRDEYLAVRTDRRVIGGRPNETTHLEFPKQSCLACIGEDIPESLLASLGIHMASGGARGRKRMVVSRYLESEQPGVYLAGDILAPAYFEAADFDADPARFPEVKHRGNIKSALRDGVLVAEVVRQRLEGREEIEVEIEDAEEPTAAAPVRVSLTGPADGGGPPAASLPPDRRLDEAAAWLVRILPGEVEENEYPVAAHAATTIGRAGCDLSFPDDTLLAPRHASISHTEDGYFLRDDGSSSGVFLQLQPASKRRLEPGDLLRVGRQFLLLTAADGEFAFAQFDHRGNEVGRHRLGERTLVLGRQAPDVNLDREDMTLSRRQLAVAVEAGGVVVKDLKSVNGTFLRVRNATALDHGDRFRLGQQRFVFSRREDPALSPDRAGSAAVPAAGAAAAPSAPPQRPEGGPAVTFKGLGTTLAVAPGQTICDAAEAAGVEITAECHSGICGSDPIRIVSGREHLDAEPADQECETLEEICRRQPGDCRLACMVRVRGPVEVEILEPG